MQLISVNLGQERTLENKGHVETTGIFKLPVIGSVKLTKLGLDGDVIISAKHHGGPDQAVYLYGQADYEWWAQELGHDIFPGTFGENLTISELQSATFNIGDRLQVGDVLLEVTAPRIPCGTFAARMGDPQFVKKFRDAERPGLYCRVLKEGHVQMGDPVSVIMGEGETVSLLDVYRDHYRPDLREDAIRRFLSAPLAIRTRQHKEKQLQQLLSEGSLL